MSRRLAGVAVAVAAVVALVCAAPAMGQTPTLEEGYEFLGREKWNRAASTFRSIVREQPRNSQALLGLIEALRGKGDVDGALEIAERAVELPRVAPQALYLQGCLLADQGELDAARLTIERAVRLGYSDAETMTSEPALEALRADGRLLVPQGYEEVSFDAGIGDPLAYLMARPAGFRAGRDYPVLIALGPGRQDLNAARYLMAHFVGEQAVQMGWVVVAPAAPSAGWAGAGASAVFASLLDEVDGRVRAEGGRVHLIGAGNGAYSALGLAPEVADRLHSITAMSGAPPPEPSLEALAPVKVRLLVGETDGTWISSVEQMYEVLDNFGIDAEFEVLPGEGNFLSSLAGDGLMLRIDALRHP